MFSAALSFVMSNGKTILIAIIIAVVLGTFAFQRHRIASLESSNKVLSDQVTQLKDAVETAKQSIENCNTGKDALQKQISDLNETHKEALANCSKIDLTFKGAVNTAVKEDQITNDKKKSDNLLKKYLQSKTPGPEFTVMTKEKSDETIEMYNNVLKPFIRTDN